MIDLWHAHETFERYLQNFDCENEKIKLKIIHTDGVIECAREITRRMRLPEEDCHLAELIALLHDIGRFEQLKKFDSFERNTMDHASFGAELLFGERRMIREFIGDDSYDSVIREAIARHSDFAIDRTMEPSMLLHASIIRDADKLDNCRVKVEESIEVMLGEVAEMIGSESISETVWQACLNHTSVLLETRKTKMDYWVSYLAYFFDINFAETAQIILEKDYVSKIIDRIPYSNPDTEEKMKLLQNMAVEYLRQMTEA